MSPDAIDPRDEVFALDEAAAFVRLSPDTLQRSDCPRARVGRRVLFRRSQLLAYIAQREGRDAA